MILDIKQLILDTEGSNTVLRTASCQVFDANGVELHYVRWCNTDTGEADHIVFNADGRLCWSYAVSFFGQSDKGKVKVERRQHPAPLRVEYLHSPEIHTEYLCSAEPMTTKEMPDE